MVCTKPRLPLPLRDRVRCHPLPLRQCAAPSWGNDSNCRIYRSIHPDGTVEENCVNTIHAEINAIAQAAKHGVSIKDSDIYITASPCIHCLKVLINVGIKTIYYDKPYKIEHIDELLRLSGIRLVQVNMQSDQKG